MVCWRLKANFQPPKTNTRLKLKLSRCDATLAGIWGSSGCFGSGFTVATGTGRRERSRSIVVFVAVVVVVLVVVVVGLSSSSSASLVSSLSARFWPTTQHEDQRENPKPEMLFACPMEALVLS